MPSVRGPRKGTPSVPLNAPYISNTMLMKYHPNVPWNTSADEIIKQYVSSCCHHLVSIVMGITAVRGSG